MHGFNSIFKRNFLTTSILLVITVLLLTVIFSLFLNSYFASEKQDQLELAVTLTEQSLEYYEGGLFSSLVLQENLLSIANIYNVSITVADGTGRVIFDLAAEGQQRTDYGKQTVMNNALLQGLSLGKGLYFVGTLGNFYCQKSAILAKQSSFPTGRVFIFAAAGMAGLDEAFRNLTSLLMLTSILILAAASLLGFVSTARLVRPIVALRNAMRGFARGEFDRRVTVEGNDEVAELTDAFNKMADELAANEKIRSEFIANVSHELKTPMTTITGFADGMLDGTIPPERRDEYLQTISEETKRLSRLVNKLLLTSRIDAGRQQIHPVRINICDIIGRCALTLEKQIEAKGLHVDVQFFDDPVYVTADPDALTQIMYNLIDNAQKYANEGGELRLSLTRQGELCEISVHNTGQGIPAEDLPHIFDRFYKVDKSRSMAKDSFGLGLFIVRTLIRHHGQDICARSAPGEYAEFIFHLPLDRQKGTDTAETPALPAEV